MKKLRTAFGLLLVAPLAAAAWGGWASVTVEDLPEYLVAERPTHLEFSIRQHGTHLLGGLKPRVEARSGGRVVDVPATAVKTEGHYAATFTLPAPGEWTITVHTSFGGNRSTLLPLTAVAADKMPTAMASAERGKQLFVGKGCTTCHTHRNVNDRGVVDVGPDLTDRHFPAEYLAQFLANPASVPARRGSLGMPNLGLREAEIRALTSFLNTEQRAQR